MARHAFRMQLKPGMQAEYRARHDAIWPELSDLLRDAGISDYWIFLDEATGALFATLELADDNGRDALPDHPVMQRWWVSMAPLMETEADNRPLEWPLTPMFHMA
ncbi:L-rhamnose mutarotase [Sphingomonas sp. CFBP 13720]|uniref:L-rhamnose mutarotase n=1 Tax=Sphingomonas sp. CFBP 13720 TaxID=2775302 RepID=UPI00177DE24D|nr:L-rhamnose mutarotase [Sphingomonas sp. CFBP 13720]MBD8676991.1 L-rhamnose mutarotase [Sphingomonas sp. CFBP 13720]